MRRIIELQRLFILTIFIFVLSGAEKADHEALLKSHFRGRSEKADHEALLKSHFRGRSSNAKKSRLVRLLDEVQQSSQVPPWFKPESWGAQQNPASAQAVFSAALSKDYTSLEGQMFCGTLRETGYKGDIVVAVQPDAQKSLLLQLKRCGAIVYIVRTSCSGVEPDIKCRILDPQGAPTPTGAIDFSPNVLRYQLYQWWARQYNSSVLEEVMVSDFADVFFQSNPFSYRTWEWGRPHYQLALFQEPYPNKAIYRCPFNSGWVHGCYGEEALRKIGANPVICSGVVMGTRDAIVAFSSLLISQLDPHVRTGEKDSSNQGCLSLGMDQGLTNWMAYGGLLERFMSVKVLPQGEGPVNTIGAYYPGTRALLKHDLKAWGILQGSGSDKWIANFNGDASPCVHQADRFLGSDLQEGYMNELKVAKAVDHARG
jgi:hypothetical protein